MKKIIRAGMLALGIFTLTTTPATAIANTAADTRAPNQAHLTRFGPKIYPGVPGTARTYTGTFNALEGRGSLALENRGIADAQIKVNGVDVVETADFAVSGKFLVPLSLGRQNTIEVRVMGDAGGELGLRVNQFTTSTMNVRALMYYGTNTASMERQRAFYNTLGLRGEIFPAGPEECRSFARSLGFKDDYRIFVALTSFSGAPPWVDTVEFRDRALRDDPPYARLNHIGMAYATYATTDLDGDYVYLREQGVEFVSAPTTAPNGERFVFLKDPDGTFLKLTEEPGGKSAGPDLTRLVNTNMNVSDMQRSRQFYRLLGFTERKVDSQGGSGGFAAAHGFSAGASVSFDGVDVSLPGTDLPLPAGGDPLGTLQLRQWKAPFDGAPPYWPPVNHLGIDRIAFFVDDLNAAMREMNRLGFEQLGPIGGGADVGSIGIVFFYDPDGIKVEFWGPVSEPNPDAAC